MSQKGKLSDLYKLIVSKQSKRFLIENTKVVWTRGGAVRAPKVKTLRLADRRLRLMDNRSLHSTDADQQTQIN